MGTPLSYGASMGCGEWQFVQLFQVTWPCPYMVKNLKSLLLRNQEADDLETWHTASGTRVLQILFQMMTIFMTGAYLFPNAYMLCMGYTAFNAHVFHSLSRPIQHTLSTQVSDIGPLILWFFLLVFTVTVCHPCIVSLSIHVRPNNTSANFQKCH